MFRRVSAGQPKNCDKNSIHDLTIGFGSSLYMLVGFQGLIHLVFPSNMGRKQRLKNNLKNQNLFITMSLKLQVFFFFKRLVNRPNVNDEWKNGLLLLPYMSVRCELKEEKYSNLNGHITSTHILVAHSINMHRRTLLICFLGCYVP